MKPNLAAAVELLRESVKDAKKSRFTPHLAFAPVDAVEIVLAELGRGAGGEAVVNQCDGCVAGYPIENGIHRFPYSTSNMVCQAEKYKARPPALAELTDEQWVKLFLKMDKAFTGVDDEHCVPLIAKAAREFLGKINE